MDLVGGMGKVREEVGYKGREIEGSTVPIDNLPMSLLGNTIAIGFSQGCNLANF